MCFPAHLAYITMRMITQSVPRLYAMPRRRKARSFIVQSMLCRGDKRQRRTNRLFASMETTDGPMRRGYSPFWTGAPAFATHAADQSCHYLFIHTPINLTNVSIMLYLQSRIVYTYFVTLTPLVGRIAQVKRTI